MADEADQQGNNQDWVRRFQKTKLDRLPTMEELCRAAEAPHDADVEYLTYLSRHPAIVRLIEAADEIIRAEAMPSSRASESKSLMDRIEEELERRKRCGEKGGELL